MAVFAFLVCIIVILIWCWQNRESIRLYMKLGSCFTTLPIVEHLCRTLGGKESLMNIIVKMGEHAQANGGLSSYWVLHKLYVVIGNAEDADFVLKKHLEKDKLIYSAAKVILHNSSLCAPVSIWRLRRKAITSLFSHRNVVNLEDTFAKLSELLADKLTPKVGGEAFCIRDYCNALSFDSACQTILGLDISSMENPKDLLRRAINFMLISMTDLWTLSLSRVRFFRRRIAACRQARQHKAVILKHIDLALSKSQEDLETCDGTNYVVNLLSLHRFSRYQLELPELHEEAILLLLAGTDTTSLSLSFAMLMLSWYPDVQARAYEEISDVFGDSDRLTTVEDLSRLRFLDAVVKESLRLYPPVPVISRQAGSDLVLRVQFSMMILKTAVVALLRRYRVLPFHNDNAACDSVSLSAGSKNTAMDAGISSSQRVPRLVVYSLLTYDHFPIRLELRSS